MKIIYTKHALIRMNERNIAVEEVENAINDPLKISFQDDQKVATNKRLNGHLLIIVYVEEGGCIKVITVITTSKISKYL